MKKRNKIWLFLAVSSTDGCVEYGQFYGVGQQWERTYLGSVLLCTCRGVAGIKCKTKPEGEFSFPQQLAELRFTEENGLCWAFIKHL